MTPDTHDETNDRLELESFARFCGFTCRIGGSDYIFRHPALPWPVFIGKPHGGRDHVWPHDIDRFVDAIEGLMGKGLKDHYVTSILSYWVSRGQQPIEERRPSKEMPVAAKPSFRVSEDRVKQYLMPAGTALPAEHLYAAYSCTQELTEEHGRTHQTRARASIEAEKGTPHRPRVERMVLARLVMQGPVASALARWLSEKAAALEAVHTARLTSDEKPQ